MGSDPAVAGVKYRFDNMKKIRNFLAITRYISLTIKDSAVVTMWQANRNSYVIYQMVPFPMTLKEP